MYFIVFKYKPRKEAGPRHSVRGKAQVLSGRGSAGFLESVIPKNKDGNKIRASSIFAIALIGVMAEVRPSTDRSQSASNLERRCGRCEK
jgi:hypothetical protein